MSDQRRKNRGAGCPCGAGRGFRTEDHAHHVYHAMTKRLGLTRAHDFYTCDHGKWHWRSEQEAAA